jgi:prephenate dehydrogenase
MTPEEHDKNMAVIQCLNHFSNLSFGNVMRREKLNLELLEKFASPAFFLKFNTVGRMLEQDASLYTDIELENPFSKDFAEKYIEAAKELYESISKKDKEKFESIFIKTKEYFGEHAEKAKKLTDEMLKNG